MVTEGNVDIYASSRAGHDNNFPGFIYFFILKVKASFKTVL